MSNAKEKRSSRIKTLRLQAGLTMAELAKKVGVATQTIQKYEEATITNIPLDRIEALASVFGVSAAYLAGWTDNIRYSGSIFSDEFEKLTDEQKRFILQSMKGLQSDQ